MKFLRRHILWGILVCPWLCFSPVVFANSSQPQDTKSINTIPEPGWTVWRPKSEMSQADFSSGFSNMELGGYLDFENACVQGSGIPQDKIDYWFRLTHSVNRMGTGTVEHGCWVKGRFFNTFTSTAIKSSLENVNCLRVNSATSNGLFIRAEPRQNSKRLGMVANGKTVDPGSFPAVIIESNQLNWVAINAPIKGWVSDGSPTGRGNLQLCRRKGK